MGSLVRIPHGNLDLLATITMVGISELAGPSPPSYSPSIGDRWLQAQLLGERDALGRFHRGVSFYPSLDDTVYLAIEDDLEGVYPRSGQGFIRLGTLSAAEHEVALDLGRLVMRHSAVVGSTGSGKSSTVASILQKLIATGYQKANVVVIDPHGEYAAAFGNLATKRSVLETNPEKWLWVPYWALGPEDLLRVYASGRGTDSPTVKTRFTQEILEARQRFLREKDWSTPRPEDISTESPTPFDLRMVWYKLDYADRATYSVTRGQGDICEEAPGNPEELEGASFKPYGPAGQAPFQGPPGEFGAFTPLVERIKARLSDPLYLFLERTRTTQLTKDPLPSIISDWLGGERAISILDFSGVPVEAADIAIGAVLNLLLNIALSSPEDSGIGRHRPLLVVLEEAHRFIGNGRATSLAQVAVERIAREGRKYGVGIMLVTQRPSEVSETVLSQCGTIIAHRLTNQTDQSHVESSLPDAIAELAKGLAALRTGEVIVAGEAIPLPSRILVDRPSPEPHAADPGIESWIGEQTANVLDIAVARMRGQREES